MISLSLLQRFFKDRPHQKTGHLDYLVSGSLPEWIPRTPDTKVSPIPLSNCLTLLNSGLIAMVRDAR